MSTTTLLRYQNPTNDNMCGSVAEKKDLRYSSSSYHQASPYAQERASSTNHLWNAHTTAQNILARAKAEEQSVLDLAKSLAAEASSTGCNQEEEQQQPYKGLNNNESKSGYDWGCVSAPPPPVEVKPTESRNSSGGGSEISTSSSSAAAQRADSAENDGIKEQGHHTLYQFDIDHDQVNLWPCSLCMWLFVFQIHHCSFDTTARTDLGFFQLLTTWLLNKVH